MLHVPAVDLFSGQLVFSLCESDEFQEKSGILSGVLRHPRFPSSELLEESGGVGGSLAAVALLLRLLAKAGLSNFSGGSVGQVPRSRGAKLDFFPAVLPFVEEKSYLRKEVRSPRFRGCERKLPVFRSYSEPLVTVYFRARVFPLG